MRAGAEVYREVAERCSAYDKRERKSCFCNVAEGEKSCLNADISQRTSIADWICTIRL